MNKTKIVRKYKAFKRRHGITKLKLLFFGIITALIFLLIMSFLNSKPEVKKEEVIKPPVTVHETPVDINVDNVKEELTFEQKAYLVYYSKYFGVIDHIWAKETGRGNNTNGLSGYCLSKGKSNEFGYAPHENFCFDTFSESISALEAWFDKRVDMTSEEALCFYNTGRKIQNCSYLKFEDTNL